MDVRRVECQGDAKVDSIRILMYMYVGMLAVRTRNGLFYNKMTSTSVAYVPCTAVNMVPESGKDCVAI
jgi:hypothetical protein